MQSYRLSATAARSFVAPSSGPDRQVLVIEFAGAAPLLKLTQEHGSGPAAHQASQSETVLRLELPDVDQPILSFPDDLFDKVVIPLGISLTTSLHLAIGEWRRVTRPAGSIVSSALGATAFRPLCELYADQLFDFGLAPKAGAAILPWRRWAQPEAVGQLLRAAGFPLVDVTVKQVGYYLPNAQAWWGKVIGSSLSMPLKRLSGQARRELKARHLEEVDMLGSSEGIWLDIPLVSVVAQKGTDPPASGRSK